MTQINWYDLARVDLDDEPEQMIRETPEVHDCEWEPELAPWHDVKRFLMVGGLIVACVTIVLYSGREILSVLGWS